MPLFSYKAVDVNGKNVLGRVEAVNLFDLDQRLARMGLDLITGAPSAQRSRLMAGRRKMRRLRQPRAVVLRGVARDRRGGIHRLLDGRAR